MGLPPLLYKKQNQQLWLRCEGAGGAFVDSSPAARTVTTTGPATQSSTFPIRGNTSGAFNAFNARISIANATSIQATTGNWIIDLFVGWIAYPNTTDGWIFIKAVGSGFCPFNAAYVLASNTIALSGFTNTNAVAYSFSIPARYFPLNARTRLTLSRSDGYVYVFVNGQIYSRAALASTTVLFSDTNALWIGDISSGIRLLNGFVDEFQLIVGDGCSYNFDPNILPS